MPIQLKYTTTESYEIQDVWLGRFRYETKFALAYRAKINRQLIILRSQAQTPVSDSAGSR